MAKKKEKIKVQFVDDLKPAITVVQDSDFTDWSTIRIQDMVGSREAKKYSFEAVEKPCHELDYCPYGCLAEFFSLQEESDEYSCDVFGHDCPVFYLAEGANEEEGEYK